jgi:hypothetical protein
VVVLPSVVEGGEGEEAPGLGVVDLEPAADAAGADNARQVKGARRLLRSTSSALAGTSNDRWSARSPSATTVRGSLTSRLRRMSVASTRTNPARFCGRCEA